MKTEIVKEPKKFKSFTVNLTFEKRTEVENIINDFEESDNEGIDFSELNPFYKMLISELQKSDK